MVCINTSYKMVQVFTHSFKKVDNMNTQRGDMSTHLNVSSLELLPKLYFNSWYIKGRETSLTLVQNLTCFTQSPKYIPYMYKETCNVSACLWFTLYIFLHQCTYFSQFWYNDRRFLSGGSRPLKKCMGFPPKLIYFLHYFLWKNTLQSLLGYRGGSTSSLLPMKKYPTITVRI